MPLFDPLLFDPLLFEVDAPITYEVIRGAMVNTVAECPPMAMFPRRERDTNTWLETGDYCQDAWTWAQLSRYIVTAGGTVHLWNDDDTVQLTSTLVGGPLGWSVVWHAATVTNEEGPTFKLKVGNTTIGRASPWDGYFEVYGLGAAASAARGLANAMDKNGFYVEADARDGNLRVDFSYGKPHPGFDHSSFADSSGNCSSPCIVIMPDRSVRLMYVIEDPTGTFKAYQRISTDDVKSWSDAELVWENAKLVRNFNDIQSTLYGSVVFRYDSGTSGPGKLYGKTRDGGDSALGAEFTVKNYDTGANLSVKDEGFDIAVLPNGQRTIMLVCVIDGETERSTWQSHDDARSFKRIT